MIEGDLRKLSNYSVHQRDSKLTTNKALINIDGGKLGGAHWTFFNIKIKKSKFFVFFVRPPINFLLQQVPKPTTFRLYKT